LSDFTQSWQMALNRHLPALYIAAVRMSPSEEALPIKNSKLRTLSALN
jgi:hypothetical protein